MHDVSIRSFVVFLLQYIVSKTIVSEFSERICKRIIYQRFSCFNQICFVVGEWITPSVCVWYHAWSKIIEIFKKTKIIINAYRNPYNVSWRTDSYSERGRSTMTGRPLLVYILDFLSFCGGGGTKVYYFHFHIICSKRTLNPLQLVCHVN